MPQDDRATERSIKFYAGASRERVDVPPVSGEETDGTLADMQDLLRRARAGSIRLPEMPSPVETARAGRRLLAAAGHPLAPPSSGRSPSLSGLRQQATIRTPDGEIDFDQTDLGEPGFHYKLSGISQPIPKGWTLVYGAALECGMASAELEEDSVLAPQGQFPVLPPWGPLDEVINVPGPASSIFVLPAFTCETKLLYEQTLLCIADKLAEIADTVGPITWSKVPAINPQITTIGSVVIEGYPPPGPWIIPPQSTADKFIVRELAMHLLSTLGFFEVFPPLGGAASELPETPYTDTTLNCSALYAAGALRPDLVLENSPDGDLLRLLIFGDPRHLPPFLERRQLAAVTQAEIVDVLESRLAIQGHILRAANRLLRDNLIPRSVFDAMAGAFQQRARATDPVRGPELMWGISPENQDPFNTVAHAVRVLEGRWDGFGLLAEGSTVTADCGGVPSTELLARAYQNPGVEARIADQRVNTPEQEFAVKTIEGAGIVIPGLLDGTAVVPRAALEEQFLRTGAAAHGIPLTELDAFTQTGEGQFISAVFANMKDEDLLFALRRSYAAYSQVVNEPFEARCIPDAEPAEKGVDTVSEIAPGLDSACALVIEQGLPRNDLGVDVTARVGGIEEAVQCHHAVEGADASQMLEIALSADLSLGAVFQDAFSLGDFFRRRLTAMRQDARFAGFPVDGTVRLLESAAAEAATWAGPGRLVATNSQRSDGQIDVAVFGIGFDPQAFGVSGVEDIPTKLRVVYGPQWVADCAAGIRATCPDNFEDTYVSAPVRSGVITPGVEVLGRTLFSDVTDAQAMPRHLGADSAFFVEFSPKNMPVYSPGETGAQHLYVVSEVDSARPGSTGRVLGALALRFTGSITSVITSDYRRDLRNQILGVGDTTADSATDNGQETSSDSESYCMEGVPVDFFVPLENELTEDSDQYENSWRHYLDLATTAAERADELGNQLIDIGLQREFRREQANEELGSICGDFGATNDLRFVDGLVDEESFEDNDPVRACLAEETIDIVFITDDPIPDLCAGETDEAACIEREILDCDGTGSVLCGKRPLRHAGLGIAPARLPAQADVAECSRVAQIMDSMRGFGLDSGPLAVAGTGSWATKETFQAVLTGLTVRLENTGDWTMTYRGRPVMDTTVQADFWPGCFGASPACDLSNELVFALETAYQSDLASSGRALTSAEKMDLFWRVTGSIWLTGMMSGGLPRGVFELPVPAINFSGLDSADKAPVPTVYHRGEYAFSGGVFRLSGFDEDRTVLGELTPAVQWNLTQTTAPAWLKAVQHPPAGLPSLTSYLFARATSAPVTFSPEELGVVTDIHSQVSVHAILGQGMKCADVHSTPLDDRVTLRRSIGVKKTTPGVKQWNSARGDESVISGVCDGGHGRLFRFLSDPETASNPDMNIADHFLGGSDPQRRLHDYIPHATNVPLTDRGHLLWNDMAARSAACVHELQFGRVAMVEKQCARDQVIARDPPADDDFGATATVLRPTVCSPAQRARLFVNSYAPETACQAMSELIQGLTLMCQLAVGGVSGPLPEPPELDSVDDLQVLAEFVRQLGEAARGQIGRLFLQNVPSRVVDDFQEGAVGSGPLAGQHGQLVLEAEAGIENIASGWDAIGGSLEIISGAIDDAAIRLQGNEIREKRELQDLALQRVQTHARLMREIANAVSGIFGAIEFYRPAEAVQSGVNGASSVEQAVYVAAELAILNEIDDTIREGTANNVLQILNDLRLATSPEYTNVQTGLREVRSGVAQTLGRLVALRDSQNAAQYQAAKGAGLDYFTDADGEAVPIPVNTVLRRQYDITQRRYDRALNEAKYLAYFARLAIEQRIGMRMNDIDFELGTVEAPSIWADDICSLTGVDFEALKTFVPPDGGALPSDSGEAETIESFADQFIGDYVSRLRNFVDFYNISFPSHDADDVAVLSLRDDLLGPQGACTELSRNLLFYSDHLERRDFIVSGEGEEGEPVVRGWEVEPCSEFEGICLRVMSGGSLVGGAAAPLSGVAGGVTWLVEEVVSAAPGGDAGTDAGVEAGVDAGGAPSTSLVPAPRTVFQRAELEPGGYVLSWWDQARRLDGTLALPGDNPPAYHAIVYDPVGRIVAQFTDVPFIVPVDGAGPEAGVPDGDAAASGNDQQWSPRRQASFDVTTPGEFIIAFAASPGTNVPGSVAIANVQLEQTSSSGAPPSAYQSTGSSRLVVAARCASTTPAQLQAAFRYECDANNVCFYELANPFLIDTTGLDTGQSRLAGKLAAGNFNFRHITTALNFVGTGVLDCERDPTQTCFGTGTAEYTLSHDAFDSRVIDHNNEPTVFNFGSGSINRGKALAAERFITLPIGSADQSLLGQPQTTKPELRGRPLEGAYRLRIYDKPSLVWSNLEDIQIVLNYRYWSRVTRQPPAE